MKKLMFAAAALAAGIAVADVQSANVVGYVNNADNVGGKNLWAPSFTAIGYNTIGLSTIKVAMPDGTTEGMTKDATFIQTINENGGMVATYFWRSTGNGASKKWGWQTENDVKVTPEAEVNIPRGDGYVLTSQTTGMILLSSGEVNTNVFTYSAAVAGKNIIANPFPTTIKLSSITVTMPDGTTEGMTKDATFIQTINENGGIDDTYFWRSTGNGASKKWGWQTEDDVKITPENDLPIPAGTAFKLTAQVADLKVIMPM